MQLWHCQSAKYNVLEKLMHNTYVEWKHFQGVQKFWKSIKLQTNLLE